MNVTNRDDKKEKHKMMMKKKDQLLKKNLRLSTENYQNNHGKHQKTWRY